MKDDFGSKAHTEASGYLVSLAFDEKIDPAMLTT
jgi:hypothetical protein